MEIVGLLSAGIFSKIKLKKNPTELILFRYKLLVMVRQTPKFLINNWSMINVGFLQSLFHK